MKLNEIKKQILLNAGITEEDLRSAYLRSANLSGANLSGADLSGANLRSANLSGANLSSADLRSADLSGANLSGADLSGADLSGADLSGADLSGADLSSAYLSGANLSSAYLRSANLSGANLSGANLSGAYLRSANLSGAKISSLTCGITLNCPEEGAFIAFKKCKGKIVKLLITEDASRLSATTYKCRANKAKVLEIEGGLSEIRSDYDSNFIYKVGEIVEVHDFDENRWNECSSGIHFFMSKEMAKQY